MYRILKYIIFAWFIVIFFSSPFIIGFLSQYNDSLLNIKENLIDITPPELFFLWNTLILWVILYLFRNF